MYHKIEYCTDMDGNAWFAHGPDFINLQESMTGWGETESEAIIDYLTQYVNLEHS